VAVAAKIVAAGAAVSLMTRDAVRSALPRAGNVRDRAQLALMPF
jgi:hypothetical protein